MRKARREGGELGSWGGCQLQPEGADGDTALGLEKSSEWEAPKESSGIEEEWEQGGEEGKEFLFATAYKHQDLQSIRRPSYLLRNRVMQGHGYSTVKHRPWVAGNLQGKDLLKAPHRSCQADAMVAANNPFHIPFSWAHSLGPWMTELFAVLPASCQEHQPSYGNCRETALPGPKEKTCLIKEKKKQQKTIS